MATQHGILLPGSAPSRGALRTCSQCDQVKRPEGGTEMGATRWICAGCWRLFNARK